MARFPSRIGRYDLITALATGGMGRVYLGRATGIGGFERKVVIKTLEVPLTAESDPAIAMFLDEARVLGQLHHQHIAGVYEVGKDEDGRHFMVLDYLEGFSAHDVWERAVEFGAALPLDFTLTVVSAVANGLHYAHTRKDIDGRPLGIVHRDVTPSNVMIGYDGAVKIIDFGIAMAVHRSTKTQTGFVKGKVGYLSPEQVSGRDVDARTDVFALGILLYELSTQHRAFREPSDLATMQRIKAGKLTRPSQLMSNYPVELEAIVMKALQVDPIDRFADADAMRRAVEALGHRLHLVLGDAAIIEVMAQLFEPHAPPKPKEPPARVSDASFEWLESDHALTVRREPEELLAQLRAESLRVESMRSDASSSGIIDEAETRQLGSTGMPDEPPRKLRAATEAADALGAQAFDTPMPGLPLASPPPTPVMTAIPRSAPRATPRSMTAAPAGPATPRGMTAAPVATPRGMTASPATPRGVTAAPVQAMPPAQPPLVPPRHGETLVGATMIRGARKRRGSLLHWVAAGAIAAVLGVGAYFVTRESTDAVAGSAAPPAAAPPVAARAPTPAPSPPKPVHADPPPPPPPPKPSQVRVKIVTHPSDAVVTLDGKKLGRTPLDETVDADAGKHVFKLKRRGYTMARFDTALDIDITQDIALTPVR